MHDDRDDEGQYTETYSDDAFIEAVNELDVASTQKIADNVGCSYDLAYRRLKELEKDSRIKHEEVGQSFIWLLI